MTAKIKDLLTLKDVKHNIPLKICLFYFGLWAIVVVMYIVGFIFLFLFPESPHKFPFEVAGKLMDRLSNPWTIGLMLFICKAFVDTDGDGVSNEFEDDKKSSVQQEIHNDSKNHFQ